MSEHKKIMSERIEYMEVIVIYLIGKNILQKVLFWLMNKKYVKIYT